MVKVIKGKKVFLTDIIDTIKNSFKDLEYDIILVDKVEDLEYKLFIVSSNINDLSFMNHKLEGLNYKYVEKDNGSLVYYNDFLKVKIKLAVKNSRGFVYEMKLLEKDEYKKDFLNEFVEEIIYPKNENSSINLVSSIKKHFKVEPQEKTLSDFSINTNKVILILMDGLGINILNKHLGKDSFLRRHLDRELIATFPPTTVAATTAILSGKKPSQTGWLGWHQYFKEVSEDVILFLGVGQYSDNDYGRDFANNRLPFTYFYDDFKNVTISNHLEEYLCGKLATLDEFKKAILEDSNKPGKQFSYFYHSCPDGIMHQEGIDSENTKKFLVQFDKMMEELNEELGRDTTIIVTADHGHVNVEPIYLINFPEIIDLLERKPSIEARTTTFWVNDKKRFIEEFNKYFKDDFILYNKQEIIEKEFFGPKSPYLEEFIGDFVAIAKSKYYFDVYYGDILFKGHHAGITKDEMLIPLIKIEKK